jgi:hypothetical protein
VKTIGHGYTWNDLEVGFKFRTLNRTITESDLVGFINATGMLEMIFIDETFQHEGGIKGGRVVLVRWCYRPQRSGGCGDQADQQGQPRRRHDAEQHRQSEG